MKTKTILVSGLTVASGLAVAGWMLFKQSAPHETAPEHTERIGAPWPPGNPTPPAVTQTPTSDPSPAEEPGNLSESAPPPRSAKMDAPQKVAPQPAQGKKPKEPILDPDARLALSLVGTDPEAERYWISAINDSNLPAHERQDLIEDLNEDGLSDPKNPGAEDLPLIVSRLQIIEELVPDAMDQVNADAFQEAYKDLANMYARLVSR